MPRRVGEPGPTGADAQRNINANRRKEARTSGSRAEHQGRVPQPGVPAGPRNKGTVTPSGETLPYVPNTTGYVAGSVKGGKKGTIRRLTPKILNERLKTFRDAEPYVPTAFPTARKAEEGEADYYTRAGGSKEYRKEALKAVAEANLQLNKKGEVKTKVEKVPIIKTSTAQIAKETKDLQKVLAQARKAGATSEELEIGKAVGARQIARRNYSLDKQGKVKMRKVVVPVPKSEKRLQRDLERVNKTTRAIRRGKRIYEPPEEEDDTPILGKLVEGVGSALDEATKLAVPTGMGTSRSMRDEYIRGVTEIADTAADAVAKLGRSMRAQRQIEETSLEGAGLGFIPDIKRGAGKAALTGANIAGEALSRPMLIVQNELARGLSGAEQNILLNELGKAVLSEKGRRDLRDAPNTVEVLLKGYGADDVKSGADLAKAAGLPAGFGLISDFALDPLMYVTFGAGVPAKFAQRAAALEVRLAEKAPEALRKIGFSKAAKEAYRTGDHEALYKMLEKAAKDNGVSTRKLGAGSKAEIDAVREVERIHAERGFEIQSAVEQGTKEAPRTKLSGEAIQKASEDVGKWLMERKERPGVTVGLNPFFVKPLGEVHIPVPKALTSQKGIWRPGAALGLFGEETKRIQRTRETEALAELNRAYGPKQVELENAIKAGQVAGKDVDALRTQLKDLQDTFNVERLAVKRQAKEAPMGRKSLDEWFQVRSSKKFAHENWRYGKALSMATEGALQRAFDDIYKPIKNDPVERVNLALHNLFEHDTKSSALLDELLPLSDKARTIQKAEREIYDEMAAFEVNIGALDRVRDEYRYRAWQEGGSAFDPIRGRKIRQKVYGPGGFEGGVLSSQMGRKMNEALAMADPAQIANAIEEVAKAKKIDITPGRARELAEKGYQFSRNRMVLEDTAQAMLRGRIVREEEFTPLMKAVIAEDRNAEVPLFQPLDKTEGILKFTDAGLKENNFLPEALDGFPARKANEIRLSSAQESVRRLEDAMKLVGPTSATGKEYQTLLKHRQAEVKALEDRLLDPSTKAPDELPITNIPNASEEYIGTLKDFRDEHPEEFPLLDPYSNAYKRASQTAVATAYRTHWRMIDQAYGKDISELHGSRWRTKDGTKEGYMKDLKMKWDDDDPTKPVKVVMRDTGEELDPAEFEFLGQAMVPVGRDNARWYDINTGYEYEFARALSPNAAVNIDKSYGSRLWPTHIMDDAAKEFFRMGDPRMAALSSGFIKSLGEYRQIQRYGLTVLFPGFAARNFISDMALSTMTSPGVWFHPLTNAKIAAIIAKRGKPMKFGPITFGPKYVKVPGWNPKMPIEDFMAAMDNLGIHSGTAIAEFGGALERNNPRALQSFFKKYFGTAQYFAGLGPGSKIGRAAREFNTRVQDIPRAMTFVQAMRDTKGNFADSMMRTIGTHFDYNDLSADERIIARNLFLFYTWYKKNIPFQFKKMLERPGIFSGLTSLYVNTAGGTAPWNQDWSQVAPWLPNWSGPIKDPALVPDYMLDSLSAVTINWNGHTAAFGFGLPWADLNRIFNMFDKPQETGLEWATLLAPEFQIGAELIYKKDPLTGADLSGREPSGAATSLNWLLEFVGTGGIAKDDKGRPVLPWAWNSIINYTPFVNRLTGYVRGAQPPSEDQGFVNTYFGGSWGSYFTGINGFIAPKEGTRLDLAYLNRVYGRAMDRRTKQEESNVTPAQMLQFDRETRAWARRLQIPDKYLHVFPGLGPMYYISQEDREGAKVTGILSPGGGVGLLDAADSSGGLFKQQDLPKGESGMGEFDEGYDMYKNPGKYAPDTRIKGLLESGFVGGGAGEEARFAGDFQLPAATAQAAIGRLRANAEAREAGAEGPETANLKEPTTKQRREHAGKPVGTPKQRKANDARVKKLKLKERTEQRKSFGKQLRELREKVNEGKLPQFEGFVDKDQEEFAQWLTVYTGFDPLFVGNWVMKEGGGYGSEGVSQGEAGEQNWLGVGYPGERTPMAESPYFNNTTPKKAAKATAEWIEGKIGGDYDYVAAPSIQEMQNYKGAPAEEIAAYLAGPSNWGTGEVPLTSISVTGFGGKKNPKAERQLKTVEAAARKAGFDPEALGNGPGLTLNKTLKAKKLKGSWGGSYAVLKDAVKGFDISSEKRAADHELSISNPGSDHNEANKMAFAYDLPTTDGQPIAETVAERLGIKNWQPGSYGPWVSPKYPGYEIQILWAVEGHYDHVHVGAHWTGADLPKGTYLGGPSSPGGSVGTAATGGSGGAAPSGGGTGGPNYKPGRSKEVEKELQQMRERMGAAGGGSGVSSSLGTGAFLTTNEAYNLGSAAQREGAAIVERAQRELEALRNRDDRIAPMPKFGRIGKWSPKA